MSETNVFMGITVEEVKHRIARLSDKSLQEEGYDAQREMNALKEALVHNPSIVDSFSEEDIGAMVVQYRGIHKSHFAAQIAKSTKPKKPKVVSQKAIKEANIEDVNLDDL